MDKTNQSSPRGKKPTHLNGHDMAAAKNLNPKMIAAAKDAAAKSTKPVATKPAKKAAADAKAKTSATAKPVGEAPQSNGERDWSQTLYLPKTDFGMKAGLPQLEPTLLERWAKLGMYKRLRKEAKGREKFILHDGPPYANGHLHIGHAVNKILKDAIVRSQQMMGKDANYVPGFDCHGLPIEWKIEEQYRAKGKSKDGIPVAVFRRECREFAQAWIGVQTEEFKRLGVEGDWDNYYATMSYDAEAATAGELLKFAMNGSLYRGSKPVMWSVVEGTALAEAEVEYHEHASPAVWVKFPVMVSQDIQSLSFPRKRESNAQRAQETKMDPRLRGDDTKQAYIVIWTTTPWTLPANRAISFSSKIEYGLYEVTAAPDDNWTKKGERFILAKKLADAFFEAARVEKWKLVEDVSPEGMIAVHPLHASGYDFKVPLLDGEHVTDDAGTGFVHTAPGHGADDFDIWTANTRKLQDLGIDAAVPETVSPDGLYYKHVPLFGGKEPKRVMDDKGSFGKLDDLSYANAAVIDALKKAGALAAMNPRYKHDYAHSWRSKAPIIHRNTPQWFIAMDKPIKIKGQKGEDTIRNFALAAIDATKFTPAQSKNRLRSMIDARPDYVISRQRVWGVPIAIFVHKETGEIIPNAKFKNAKALIDRIVSTFKAEGVDPWFAKEARETFLDGLVENPDDWEQVRDILDVWFDSASTHVFVLKARKDLKWPADIYLEGSDQHRGWFHSSLLESCGTTGRAPYDGLVTHGFVLDEKGRKMSKSLNNTVAPQDVIKQSGADILRLWVLSSDYADDMRVGPEILKSTADGYRKLRNTLRYLLGNLAHYEPKLAVKPKDMPELERWVLHRLASLDADVRKAYHDYDFKRAYRLIAEFCSNDLSAIYFDIRKDTLYCEAPSSLKRRAALTVLDKLFETLTAWLAPILCFTAEEAWLERHGKDGDNSVHLQSIPNLPKSWKDKALDDKWQKIWAVRSVITGALEIERREKRIGSALEAAPEIYISDKALAAEVKDVDWAEITITSAATVKTSKVPADAFALSNVAGVGVVPKLAQGHKCARSWRITKDVGKDKDYPALSARDAAAVRELDDRLKA